MPLKYSEVVKVIDLQPYLMPGNAPLSFRVEIMRNHEPDHFHARVYRHELLRVQPTFPQGNGTPKVELQSDQTIWVLDDFLASNDFSGKTPDEVLEKIEVIMAESFSTTSGGRKI